MTPLIFEEFTCEHAEPEQMDALWARGWRHFGTQFFRNSLHFQAGEWLTIVPLRIRLADYKLSKSQRRVLRKNADVECRVEPLEVTDELRAMFHRHKQRFTENVPENLSDFLGADRIAVLQETSAVTFADTTEMVAESPSRPCETMMISCYLSSQKVAVSFLDVGLKAASSVYGIFEPEHSARSLGIFTMLKEIEYAQRRGMEFLYPGYATHEPSHYDYKKQFAALEGYDWWTEAWGRL
jgi:arginyl-tRNA--protein-N-Asp/Glu arginylyltransferase